MKRRTILPILKKSEDMVITYDQKKITLKGRSLNLEMDLPMASLLAIYSSGRGTGISTFTIKIPDDYQKVPQTVNSIIPEVKSSSNDSKSTDEIIYPNSVFPPFTTIPVDDQVDSNTSPVGTDSDIKVDTPVDSNTSNTPVGDTGSINIPITEIKKTTEPAKKPEVKESDEDIVIEVLDEDKDIEPEKQKKVEPAVKKETSVKESSYEEFEEVSEPLSEKPSSRKSLEDVKKENPYYLPRRYNETG